jgi:A/G-specific adenine glycosylase
MLKPRYGKPALTAPEKFRDALADWFSSNGKDYPWRRTKDPYAILVSEVMLQQTQITTVLNRGFYVRFMEAFPDLPALAEATDDALLKAWEGLGYYRRVRMLRQTAQAVLTEHGGAFPRDLETLMRLPGIGRYTAGAILAFAYDQPSAVLDGNVARVLSRLMDFQSPIDTTSGQKQLWKWAEELADPGRPRIYNSALMELGQTLCRPGVPDCLSCPVANHCLSREPINLPVKGRKSVITPLFEHALWKIDADGNLLVHREAGARRNGLWRLPTRPAADVCGLPVLTETIYGITRYRVTLKVHDARDFQTFLRENESVLPPDEVLKLAMPAPFRKVIERLFDSG